MKKVLYLLCLISCVNTSSQVIENIGVLQFELLIKKEDAVILDVRTFQEFVSGHIEDATNIDFHADDFIDKLKIVRKDVPIYVYCKSGGRSAAAARNMQELGFTKVYNLVGGIGAWESASYPIIKSKGNKKLSPPIFTALDIEDILQTNEIVLMSFTTQWCVPCQKMKPIIENVKKENSKVKVLLIDVDANKELMKKWEIEGIPAFIIFKNSIDIFRHIGLISQQELLDHLN